MSVMEAESVSDVIADIVRWRDALADLPPARTESEAIDRITALEELTSAAAAAQARETLTFDMHRRNREAEDGVPSDKQGRGVGAEIGLARKVSRARGAKLVGFSRALLMDLPRTYAALSAGPSPRRRPARSRPSPRGCPARSGSSSMSACPTASPRWVSAASAAKSEPWRRSSTRLPRSSTSTTPRRNGA